MNYLHFLLWAATQRKDFRAFELCIQPPIKLDGWKIWHTGELQVVITIRRPKLIFSVPYEAREAYDKAFNRKISTKFDDVPF